MFSKAFEKLEEMKNEQIILDFSIYHTTLENVFLDFSRHQRPEVDQTKKIMFTRRARKSSIAKRDSFRRAVLILPFISKTLTTFIVGFKSIDW